jgi:hypothetical protein
MTYKKGLIIHGSLGLSLLLYPMARAQEQPAAPAMLENSGKPMIVPFRCAGEDFQWAGLACSEDDPCPVYLEISAVEPAGARLFAAGNIHSSAVTLYAELLVSDDGGRTWREAQDRIRGAGLDRIQFTDAENGWVGGQLLYPLSQNAFLLVTADGGKSWTRQPIFEESRAGSIQDFTFTAKREGRLVFDRGPGEGNNRYELYESGDGGASWTLKEAGAKPQPLKPAPAPSDWRARADGPTQSFQIEKRAGERWTPVAAFAVKLGICGGEPEAPSPH